MYPRLKRELLAINQGLFMFMLVMFVLSPLPFFFPSLGMTTNCPKIIIGSEVHLVPWRDSAIDIGGALCPFAAVWE